MPLAQLNQIMRFTLAALVSMLLSLVTSSAAPRLLDCTLNEVETMEGQNFDLEPESRSISLALDEESRTITLYQDGAGQTRQVLSHVTFTQIAINGYTDNTSVGIQVSSGNIVLQSYALKITKAEFGICHPGQKQTP